MDYFLNFKMNASIKKNGSLNLTAWLFIPQEECDDFPVKLIKTMAYSVLLIVALFGNCLVIAVICRNRRLRTIINFFILNMAVSDLLMPLFALPTQIQGIYLPNGLWLVDGLFGSLTCKLMEFTEDTSILVSALSLLCVATERFFGIVFPMKTQPINSKNRCFTLIALTWLIGALLPSTNFYTFKIFHKGGRTFCALSWEPAFNDHDASKVHWPIVLVCYCIIPFILLTSLYSAIIISLYRQKVNLNLASIEIQRRAKKYRRITYMLVTVVAVFLVTWTPFNIYKFKSVYGRDLNHHCVSNQFSFGAYFVLYSYPAINPFIYYIFNYSYRKGFQELLSSLKCFRSCCKNHDSSVQGKINHAFEQVSSKSVVLLSLRSIQTER